MSATAANTYRHLRVQVEFAVASNLACVGLDVEGQDDLGRLLGAVVPKSRSLGIVAGVDVRRWEDPSGSRLVLGIQDGQLVDLLPSFASHPGAQLAGVSALNPEVAAADVVDEEGETLTRMAVEIEERRFLSADDEPRRGPAAITALGVNVTLHVDEEDFASSSASLLDPAKEGQPPPPNYVERGLKWPPRMGESPSSRMGCSVPETPTLTLDSMGRSCPPDALSWRTPVRKSSSPKCGPWVSRPTFVFQQAICLTRRVRGMS